MRFPALAVGLWLTLGASAAGAQVVVPQDAGRTWTDLAFGLGVQRGTLRFEGRQYQALPRDMKLETALDAVPTASLGVRHWVDRHFGFSATGTVGYLSALKIPTTLATTSDGQEASLQLITRQLQADLLYRLYLGSSVTAPALQGQLGFDLTGYDVQETEPALLVSTTYVGPRAALGVHLPLGSSFAVTLSGSASLPIYVDEQPVDSGRLDSSLAFGGDLSLEYLLGTTLALELTASFADLDTQFTEHGSRGISGHGVFDGQAHDTFLHAGLNLRWRL